mmetsp:Transcript_1161/g.4330  ORF Transcript_1161/g.4330 Transcript_1161/m.4330 type:complete len:425 (-) Transcript_1161:2510-3784(-)
MTRTRLALSAPATSIASGASGTPSWSPWATAPKSRRSNTMRMVVGAGDCCCCCCCCCCVVLSDGDAAPDTLASASSTSLVMKSGSRPPAPAAQAAPVMHTATSVPKSLCPIALAPATLTAVSAISTPATLRNGVQALDAASRASAQRERICPHAKIESGLFPSAVATKTSRFDTSARTPVPDGPSTSTRTLAHFSTYTTVQDGGATLGPYEDAVKSNASSTTARTLAMTDGSSNCAATVPKRRRTTVSAASTQPSRACTPSSSSCCSGMPTPSARALSQFQAPVAARCLLLSSPARNSHSISSSPSHRTTVQTLSAAALGLTILVLEVDTTCMWTQSARRLTAVVAVALEATVPSEEEGAIHKKGCAGTTSSATASLAKMPMRRMCPVVNCTARGLPWGGCCCCCSMSRRMPSMIVVTAARCSV